MSADGLTQRAVYEYRQEQKRNKQSNYWLNEWRMIRPSPWPKWVLGIVIGIVLAVGTYHVMNKVVVERHHLEQR